MTWLHLAMGQAPRREQRFELREGVFEYLLVRKRGAEDDIRGKSPASLLAHLRTAINLESGQAWRIVSKPCTGGLMRMIGGPTGDLDSVAGDRAAPSTPSGGWTGVREADAAP